MLPTKSSSEGGNRVRHGFGAKTSLPPNPVHFSNILQYHQALLVLYHSARILDQCRCSLEPIDMFLFFCWWQAKFSLLCRGWISNKSLAFNSNGKYISYPVICYTFVHKHTFFISHFSWVTNVLILLFIVKCAWFNKMKLPVANSQKYYFFWLYS